MAKVKMTAAVTLQEQLAADIYDMRIKAPEIAESAVPGQFVSLYSKDGARILPRPISLCGIDKEKGELRLVYRIAGEGTKEFSGLAAGDTIDVLGPLGNGFPLQAGKRAFLIGGGIGVPPMLELAKALHGLNRSGEDSLVRSVLGYRDSQMFLKDELRHTVRYTLQQRTAALAPAAMCWMPSVSRALRRMSFTPAVPLPCSAR